MQLGQLGHQDLRYFPEVASANAYHVMTSVFEVDGMRVKASIFINT